MTRIKAFTKARNITWLLLSVSLGALLLSSACKNLPKGPVEVTVQDGDTVAVNYRGTLDDGSEFDSSYGREPLSFTMGQGQLIPGFENAVKGHKVGDKVDVRLEAADAYGEK